MNLFNSLNEEQKDFFFRILRQVEIDTLSGLLFILDGGILHEGKVVDLVLSVKGQNNILNGDLHNVLLELEEE